MSASLYDSDMWRAGAVAAVLVFATLSDHAAGADRLIRVRELGAALSTEADTPAADREAALSELFALADDEIVESLRAGEPFASAAFIQERLDSFMSTWGGAGLRVHRLGDGTRAVTVGVFTLPGPAPRGSVRVYGRRGDDAGMLASVAHDGAPELHRWRSGRDGAPQFAASWLGAASGAGGRSLEVELWRGGGAGVERVWSLAAVFPRGLSALGFAVREDGVSVRYEAPYEGRKPGCAGQTELVDLYRPDAKSASLALARRAVVNGWHRELQGTVGRLLAALASGDRTVIAELVPDRALASRLPPALTREPACDEATGAAPTSATVAATEERDGRMVPWTLSWRRVPKGWRVVAATRMLQ